MYDCIVIGDVTIDTFLLINEAHLQCDVHNENCEICFAFGAKIPIEDSYQSIGGNAANVSSALHKLGAEVALVSELGDDLNGHTALETLEKLGVDTSLVTMHKGKDTRYSTIINFQTDRTVFSYHAPRQYTLPKLPETEWVYYTSLGASFERVQKAIIEQKKKQAFQVAVNPGSYQINTEIRSLKKILPYTDLLFVNKEEAALFVGAHTHISKLTALLHEQGVGIVVITDGEEGSYASNGRELLHMPIYPHQQISKTGAGDAYASGFLAAHIGGMSLATCMQWGTANAGGVVQQMGAQEGQQTEAEIQHTITLYPKTTPVTVN